MKRQIRVTERQNQSFITGIGDGAVIGYKYFEFFGTSCLGLELRGSLNGTITVAHDEAGKEVIGAIELNMAQNNWQMILVPISPESGSHALYLLYEGTGEWEFKTFCFFTE